LIVLIGRHHPCAPFPAETDASPPSTSHRFAAKCVQVIDNATDERDLYAMKSLHFEKLQGREPQRSMRLNRQWRVIVELEESGARKKVRIIGIEDYH
jgi:plasmid maintenance system killer protein